MHKPIISQPRCDSSAKCCRGHGGSHDGARHLIWGQQAEIVRATGGCKLCANADVFVESNDTGAGVTVSLVGDFTSPLSGSPSPVCQSLSSSASSPELNERPCAAGWSISSSFTFYHGRSGVGGDEVVGTSSRTLLS